jgi:hypothetical protein
MIWNILEFGMDEFINATADRLGFIESEMLAILNDKEMISDPFNQQIVNHIIMIIWKCGELILFGVHNFIYVEV